MKILVPIKRVPDPYGKVRLTADGQLDASDIKWVVNPFDEIALEEAVRIRERGVDAEIVTVTVGSAICEEQLRTSLAMGSDRAILVEDDGTLDPTVVSHLLAEVVRRETPDLVLMGKQAIDDDFNQTGQMLAAFLNWPIAPFASEVTLAADRASAVVVREVDAGRETVSLKLPAVITVDLRLNEPRYVALPAIIKARSKPIDRLGSADLGAHPQSKLSIRKLTTPPTRKAGRRVSSVDELISVLRDEARVIA
ncbi:MAG: electron transfer flavoprotein subunit beta/FixA family protein [Chthonomonadales bacterium]